MLQWLVIIALLIVAVVGFVLFFGQVFGRGEALPPVNQPRAIIDHNRRSIAADNLDAVRLELVPRGYSPQQVDALIADLAARAGLESANGALMALRPREAEQEIADVAPLQDPLDAPWGSLPPATAETTREYSTTDLAAAFPQVPQKP